MLFFIIKLSVSIIISDIHINTSSAIIYLFALLLKRAVNIIIIKNITIIATVVVTTLCPVILFISLFTFFLTVIIIFKTPYITSIVIGNIYISIINIVDINDQVS